MGGGNAKPPGTPFTPTLYNLDTDIGETTDVAAEHPEVVERLQKFIAEMDADLGVKKPGPGVRPPGRVKQATGLYLAGDEPAAVPEPGK
jgi:arylsulfatase A